MGSERDCMSLGCFDRLIMTSNAVLTAIDNECLPIAQAWIDGLLFSLLRSVSVTHT